MAYRTVCSSCSAFDSNDMYVIPFDNLLLERYSSDLPLNIFIRRYVMAIDLSSKSLDFSCSTIDDLILADIKLQAIVDKIGDYNYPMEWLKEKHEEIKAELEVRMRKYYREELKKLEKERKQYETKEDRLKEIDQKIEKMKALK